MYKFGERKTFNWFGESSIMNIVTLIRIEDGKRFQGFLDWDGMERNVNFYYYDDEKNGWSSDKLGKFKPIPLNVQEEINANVIGG